MPTFVVKVSEEEMIRWTEYLNDEGYINEPRLLESPQALVSIGLEIVELHADSVVQLED